jgi:hypothetical protein
LCAGNALNPGRRIYSYAAENGSKTFAQLQPFFLWARPL